MEVQRERLGLQIDELSAEILDNARKSNDVSQSMVRNLLYLSTSFQSYSAISSLSPYLLSFLFLFPFDKILVQ